jgi:GNAT superfamily N-acetyltransferase
VSYEIRNLFSADLADTADLWFRSWHAAFPNLLHPMPFEAWLARLRDDIAATCICRVAILNADVVGFLAVDIGKASLEQIFVTPEHQGMGVGKMLVEEAKLLCPSGLMLTTLQRNEKAATFYIRQGFERGAASTNPVNGLPSVEFFWRPSNHPWPA